MGRVPIGASARHAGHVSSLGQTFVEPGHLVKRFFTSLSARPASIAAEQFADEHLSVAERAFWIQMSNQDRRHSAGVARRFLRVRPEATGPEIAGALLHDVGKIECGLGTFARTVATVIGPRTSRFALYHDHEAIGAKMLEDAGSDPATVELVAGYGPAYDDLEACDR